ncbi:MULTISPECIES: ABC transporter substrate-binding protein [unclassified Halomonas]|uniref:ABC transporter substrate-binding protein n=1 Tax=unclassified Halomonas TaxID=2609666 RepID=UPI0021E38859|nr:MULTISPECIES: ABC transporter substrate-binding protein [unclassified Halomonas]UYF98834.1 ABC transporter substrate-binding protein [Halomonas sp. GD1P12]WNL40048.1 ABC transporter substrate-binding protein [Halomonas sp. PAMB 3232]
MRKKLPNTRLAAPLLMTGIALSTAPQAVADDDTLDFGVPAWPGITVKTEIAEQLLNRLGYDTQAHELGLQVVYQGIESGDVDAFLGVWLPAQRAMFTPRRDDGTLVDVANNVDGAQMTLAVPEYTYERGIQSFSDLTEHRDAFNGEILGFGAGSAASEILQAAIDDDVSGFGDWRLRDTSEVGMLSAAQDAIAREQDVVWVGWTPHWMNLELPMRYLDDPNDLFGENNGESEVLTVLRGDYANAHPNLVGFFEQFTFSADEQSWMIQAFGRDEGELDEVARQWITEHPERVEAMLADVTTKDGEPAWPVIQAAYR